MMCRQNKLFLKKKNSVNLSTQADLASYEP